MQIEYRPPVPGLIRDKHVRQPVCAPTPVAIRVCYDFRTNTGKVLTQSLLERKIVAISAQSGQALPLVLSVRSFGFFVDRRSKHLRPQFAQRNLHAVRMSNDTAMRLFWTSLFMVGVFTCAFAQMAVVRTNTTPRAGPSSNEAKEGSLNAGDVVSILDTTPEHGYYQVQTSTGRDGWVFSKSLRIVARPSSSQPATDPKS